MTAVSPPRAIWLRFRTISARYYYFLSALLCYGLVRRHEVRHLKISAGTKRGCLVIAPMTHASIRRVVVHLHGMGDNKWRAFRDGIGVFPQRFGAILVVPDLRDSPWCSDRMLVDLESLLSHLHRSYPHAAIVLSGTSMGGSIALSALTNSAIREKLSGVIAVSAATRLDQLLTTTDSESVRGALLASVDHDRDKLRDKSLHYSIPDISVPVCLLYSAADPVIPSVHLLETATQLSARGIPLRLVRMDRPRGHYRPLAAELCDALSWIHDAASTRTTGARVTQSSPV